MRRSADDVRKIRDDLMNLSYAQIKEKEGFANKSKRNNESMIWSNTMILLNNSPNTKKGGKMLRKQKSSFVTINFNNIFLHLLILANHIRVNFIYLVWKNLRFFREVNNKLK